MNTCQAYTKKRMPCKNNAMEDSHLCSFHEGIFKDFPPVRISALMCPYCEKPIERGAKFCKFCRNYFFICQYCDEPLKKDVKSCRFCKEDLTPAVPKHDKLYYFNWALKICNSFASKVKAIDISYVLFMAIIFLIFLFAFSFLLVDTYFHITNY